MRSPSLKKPGAAASTEGRARRSAAGESRLRGLISKTQRVTVPEPVSPGNPLWAHIILPADRGDVAAGDPLQQVGHEIVCVQRKPKAEACRPAEMPFLIEAWVEQLEQSSLGSMFLKLKPRHGWAWMRVRDEIMSRVWILIVGRCWNWAPRGQIQRRVTCSYQPHAQKV